MAKKTKTKPHKESHKSKGCQENKKKKKEKLAIYVI